MKNKNWLVAAAEQVAKFTPKKGFNVVATDSYEHPGEALYLVKNVDSEEAAEKLATEHEKKSGNKTYVYPAKSS